MTHKSLTWPGFAEQIWLPQLQSHSFGEQIWLCQLQSHLFQSLFAFRFLVPSILVLLFRFTIQFPFCPHLCVLLDVILSRHERYSATGIIHAPNEATRIIPVQNEATIRSAFAVGKKSYLTLFGLFWIFSLWLYPFLIWCNTIRP